MLKITLSHTYQCKCFLGEGLHFSDYGTAWVDINRNLIFIADSETMMTYSTKSTPSIVLAINQDEIEFGSDAGVCSFSKKTGKEVQLLPSPHASAAQYRSNDGGCCGTDQLLGFMHSNNPTDNSGYVYKILGQSWELLDNTIHIPNTFVEIAPSKILISDSLKGQIWLFELDANGGLRDKTLWAQLESGSAPDGGCLVGDVVLIALWDGAAIAVFTKSGELIEKLTVPVIRPTNCKYDSQAKQLWVTSASEGLSKEQLKGYPDSGDTFVFDLEFL